MVKCEVCYHTNFTVEAYTEWSKQVLPLPGFNLRWQA